SIGNRLINARAETVAERSAFRREFLGRLCLVVPDVFETVASKAGRFLVRVARTPDASGSRTDTRPDGFASGSLAMTSRAFGTRTPPASGPPRTGDRAGSNSIPD